MRVRSGARLCRRAASLGWGSEGSPASPARFWTVGAPLRRRAAEAARPPSGSPGRDSFNSRERRFLPRSAAAGRGCYSSFPRTRGGRAASAVGEAPGPAACDGLRRARSGPIDAMENRGLLCTLCSLVLHAPLLLGVTGEWGLGPPGGSAGAQRGGSGAARSPGAGGCGTALPGRPRRAARSGPARLQRAARGARSPLAANRPRNSVFPSQPPSPKFPKM